MPCKEQLRTLKNGFSLYRSCTASLEPKLWKKVIWRSWQRSTKTISSRTGNMRRTGSASSNSCPPIIRSSAFAADIIGYLVGYANLTNTRSLALLGDPDAGAYELLFSFSSPEEKNEFLNLVRSNEDMGEDYIISLRRPPPKKLGMLVHSQRSYPRMPSPMSC